MRGSLLFGLAGVALAGCGSGFSAGAGEPEAGAGVTGGSGGAAGVQAAATGQGGAATAGSTGSSGSSTAASSSTASSSSASSSASSSVASSSASASSSGAGGAPPECDGKAKGTQCFSNCGCPMPNCYVPNDNLTCTAGLCDGKGACQKFLPVTCKIGAKFYAACTGFPAAAAIYYNGGAGKCENANSAGYCAPGVDCFVAGVNGSGVCQ